MEATMTMMEPNERTGHPIPAAVSAEAATAPMPSLDDVYGETEDDLLPGDGAGDMGDACSSAAVPGVMLIDPEILDRAIGSTSFCGDRPEPTSREDEERLAFLRRYAEAEGGLFRRHIVADAAMVAGLKSLRAEAPNAGALIDVVERAALLSWHANSPLRVPPVLAVGPPGTGKSRIARRITEILQSMLVVIDGGATKDQGPFVGHDVGYRGSGPGKVARALLDGQSSAPCLLVDEVDKVSAYNYGVRPMDSLLALLEPTTAGDFTDCYVGLPMHAEGMIVLMTANDVAGLPGPLLDRVVIVDMPRLNRAATRDAIRRMFAELMVEHALPEADLDGAALDRLERTGLRQARRIIGLALGPALAAGRGAPDAADVASACALIERRTPRPRRSSSPPAVRVRPPVGFVHFTPGSDDTVGRIDAPPRGRG